MRIVALQLTCAPLPVAFHRIPAGNVGVGCYSELAPAHTCKLAERERERERERGRGGEERGEKGRATRISRCQPSIITG